MIFLLTDTFYSFHKDIILKEVHEMGFELIPEPDLNRTESNQSINSAARIIHKTMTLNSIGIYFET